MLNIKETIKLLSNKDKVKCCYRFLEILRLEHNQKGKDFKDGKITFIEWNDYVENTFKPRTKEIFLELNKVKDKLGYLKGGEGEFTKKQEEGYSLKEVGKQETNWDNLWLHQV